MEKLVNYGTEKIYSKEFEEITSLLHAKQSHGVYIFSIKGEYKYIGKSVNLGARIVQSYQERFCMKRNIFFDGKYKPMTADVFVQYLETETKSDLLVLESYLIAKYKPILNRDGKFDDATTIKIDVPDFSRKIRVVDAITHEYLKETYALVKDKEKGKKIFSVLNDAISEAQ